MALVTCPDCQQEHSDAAPACPKCGRPNKPAEPSVLKKPVTSSGCAGIGCLALVVIMVIGLIVGGSGSPGTSIGTASVSPAAPPPDVTPVLELQSWRWHTEYGYAIVEGTVKNISSRSMENVAAVAIFRDAKGEFITSDDALTDFNPILPGQTSPFKVMATENPAMHSANVDFKFLMGGSINWRAREPKKPAR